MPGCSSRREVELRKGCRRNRRREPYVLVMVRMMMAVVPMMLRRMEVFVQATDRVFCLYWMGDVICGASSAVANDGSAGGSIVFSGWL